MMLRLSNVACLLHIFPICSSFSMTMPSSRPRTMALSAETELTEVAEPVVEPEVSSKKAAESLRVPLTWDEMVRQAASAVKEASRRGDTRQIIRVLVPRDSASGDFGKYSEADSRMDMENAVLYPPDESWQGGIMQLYRAGSPTCSALIRKVTEDSRSGLPPRVEEDRSVDESRVDGIGLFRTDDGSVACWLQPTQEVVDDIVDASQKARDDELQILMNPQWRQVDDALDSASRGEGFMSGLASFLGGKGGTVRRLKETGFSPVYSLEGYVCRGSNVRLLQVLDSDWAVFCQRDDGDSFVSVGTSATRPTYQEVENLLQKADIGFKYARDIGISPKL